MADYFASIFGTEKDKVNCSFYLKIGACRHGDRCSRVHNKPTFSQTILIQNLYVNPQNSAKAQGESKEISDEETQRHFDEFFEDIYVELEEKYGPIEEMNVCDNLGDHLIGNVYVKFKREKDAEQAVEELNKRWFAGKPVYAELSTVTDFREAGCRQYEVGACTRGGFCNFMHLKQISKSLKRELYGSSKRSRRSHHRSRRSISRSRSWSASRSKSISKSPRSHTSISVSPKEEKIHRSRSRSASSSRSSRRRDARGSPILRRSRHRIRSRTRSKSLSPVQLRSRSRSPRSPRSPQSRSRRSHKSSSRRHRAR